MRQSVLNSQLELEVTGGVIEQGRWEQPPPQSLNAVDLDAVALGAAMVSVGRPSLEGAIPAAEATLPPDQGFGVVDKVQKTSPSNGGHFPILDDTPALPSVARDSVLDAARGLVDQLLSQPSPPQSSNAVDLDAVAVGAAVVSVGRPSLEGAFPAAANAASAPHSGTITASSSSSDVLELLGQSSVATLSTESLARLQASTAPVAPAVILAPSVTSDTPTEIVPRKLDADDDNPAFVKQLSRHWSQPAADSLDQMPRGSQMAPAASGPAMRRVSSDRQPVSDTSSSSDSGSSSGRGPPLP